jgi:hypothetical protein
VIGRADLLYAKLRAASDPARRRSKRLQDLADAHALVEGTPALAAELGPAERALLDQAPPETARALPRTLPAAGCAPRAI